MSVVAACHARLQSLADITKEGKTREIHAVKHRFDQVLSIDYSSTNLPKLFTNQSNFRLSIDFPARSLAEHAYLDFRYE